MSFFSFVLLALVLFSLFTWYVRHNLILWAVAFMSWVMVLSNAKAQLWALVAQAWSALTA
jgi:hypothetical protein